MQQIVKNQEEMLAEVQKAGNGLERAIAARRAERQDLQRVVLAKRDELEGMQSKSKLELQSLNFEHEQLMRK